MPTRCPVSSGYTVYGSHAHHSHHWQLIRPKGLGLPLLSRGPAAPWGRPHFFSNQKKPRL